MRQIFAAPKGRIAAFDGGDKAGFLVEILHKNILNQLIRMATLPRGRLRQAGFEFWLRDLDFIAGNS